MNETSAPPKRRKRRWLGLIAILILVLVAEVSWFGSLAIKLKAQTLLPHPL